jgi:undecaprenyl-diphosphatase
VSSTGHLLVTQRLLGIPASEAANAFAIVIQGGAIVAVLGLYRARLGEMVRGVAGREPRGRLLVLAVVVAFLPAAVMGLAFEKRIEAFLFGPWPIVVAWAAGGLLLLGVAPRVTSEGGEPLEQITPRQAFLIGVAQCAALWPGVSRSLATILGGVATGLSLGAAVEFSFLLGLATLGAATGYKALKAGPALMAAYGPLEMAVGFLVAWLAAVVSVRFMVGWLASRGLGLFGWWRLGAATLVSGLLLGGLLRP